MILSNRFTEALTYATQLHANQVRKGRKDYRELGESVWERFKGGREGTLWYYRVLVEAFRKVSSTPLIDELERVVSELEKLANG